MMATMPQLLYLDVLSFLSLLEGSFFGALLSLAFSLGGTRGSCVQDGIASDMAAGDTTHGLSRMNRQK